MAPVAAPTATLSEITCSYQQVIAAAMLGGFPLADVVTAAAICAAESSRNCAAISPLASDQSRGYGLWQIEFPTHQDLFYKYANTGGSDPSKVTGPYGGLITGDWMDPATNAKMAYAIKQSQGWGAWTTYTTGAYLAYKLQAQAAFGSVQNMWPDQLQALLNPLVAPVGTQIAEWRTGLLGSAAAATGDQAIAGVGGSAAQGAVQTLKAFQSPLDFLNALADPKTWTRVATVVVGGGLVLVAVSMLLKQSAVQQVASAAGKVIKK
jgi:hypothetical protein